MAERREIGGREALAVTALAVGASCFHIYTTWAFMNSTLGVTAALTGNLMGSLLQHPAVLIFVSSVFLLMALNFFGLWELRLPYFLSSFMSKSHTGYARSLFMGLTLGIVAAPCIGPFIIGLLTMVAQKGDPLFGFLTFFILSLGLGLPLFILSLFAGNLSKLPRSGEWLLWIRKFFGWIMLAMAAYFIKPIFPQDMGTYILAIVIFASGVHLGFLNKIGQTLRTFVFIKRITGILAISLSLFLVLSMLLQGPGVSPPPRRCHVHHSRLPYAPVHLPRRLDYPGDRARSARFPDR